MPFRPTPFGPIPNLANSHFGQCHLGQNPFMALDEMALDEMGMEEVVIPHNYTPEVRSQNHRLAFITRVNYGCDICLCSRELNNQPPCVIAARAINVSSSNGRSFGLNQWNFLLI